MWGRTLACRSSICSTNQVFRHPWDAMWKELWCDMGTPDLVPWGEETTDGGFCGVGAKSTRSCSYAHCVCSTLGMHTDEQCPGCGSVWAWYWLCCGCCQKLRSMWMLLGKISRKPWQTGISEALVATPLGSNRAMTLQSAAGNLAWYWRKKRTGMLSWHHVAEPVGLPQRRFEERFQFSSLHGHLQQLWTSGGIFYTQTFECDRRRTGRNCDIHNLLCHHATDRAYLVPLKLWVGQAAVDHLKRIVILEDLCFRLRFKPRPQLPFSHLWSHEDWNHLRWRTRCGMMWRIVHDRTAVRGQVKMLHVQLFSQKCAITCPRARQVKNMKIRTDKSKWSFPDWCRSKRWCMLHAPTAVSEHCKHLCL